MVKRAGIEHTNGTDDGGTAEVLGRHHLGVELGVPLQLHPVGQVVEGASGSHYDSLRQRNCDGRRKGWSDVGEKS